MEKKDPNPFNLDPAAIVIIVIAVCWTIGGIARHLIEAFAKCAA